MRAVAAAGSRIETSNPTSLLCKTKMRWYLEGENHGLRLERLPRLRAKLDYPPEQSAAPRRGKKDGIQEASRAAAERRAGRQPRGEQGVNATASERRAGQHPRGEQGGSQEASRAAAKRRAGRQPRGEQGGSREASRTASKR